MLRGPGIAIAPTRGASHRIANVNRNVTPAATPPTMRYPPKLFGLDFGDLVDAPLVTTTFELGDQPDPQDLVGETLGHDAGADRQHVGIVVTPRVLRGVEVVAERGA